MRIELVGDDLPQGVRVVAGCGEALPLRSASIDVAWLSAVVHHLRDIDATARELRRVLVDDGVVLIRGLFADGDAPPGLRYLPGWECALSRFPSTEEVKATLSASGFDIRGRTEVADTGPSTVGQAAEWVRRLRQADSFLARLTDEEIDEGLAVMDDCDADHPVQPATLTLISFAVR